MRREDGSIRRTDDRNFNLQSSLSCTHSEDDTETIELSGRHECSKLIRDLVVETARHHSLVVVLGSASDTELLREEIKRTQKKAVELIQQNKVKLQPYLLHDICGSQEKQEFERLWNLFCACVDGLQSEMRRSFNLKLSFPIFVERSVRINTGIVTGIIDGFVGPRLLPLELLSVPLVDKKVQEKDDLRILERDIQDLQSIMLDMQCTVDIKPWAGSFSKEQNGEDKARSPSGDQESATSDLISMTGYDQQRRRKCICLVAVTLLSLTIFATVLGVCVVVLV